MKKILISVLLLSQGIGAALKVDPVSAERVSQFQAELEASQKKRDTHFKWAKWGTGTAIFAGLVWKAHSNYAVDLQAYADAIGKIDGNKQIVNAFLVKDGEEVAELIEKASETKLGRLNSIDWLASLPGGLLAMPAALFKGLKNGVYAVPELILDGVRATPSALSFIAGNGLGLGKDLVKNTAKLAYENAPGALSYAGLGYIATQASKFILPAIPSIGDYFNEVRSIKWCLVKHSNFYNVMINFKNWIAYEIAHGYQSNDTAEIVLCGSHLVLETERILGYMAFVAEALDTSKVGYSFYKKRADACMAALAAETNTLAAEINVLVSVEVTPEQMESFIDILRKRLFRTIIQLENFEVVTSATGMASPYEEDVFDPLKSFIYPEWRLGRPVVQDPNHTFLDDMFAQEEEV